MDEAIARTLDAGSIEGYVVDETAEQIPNWLSLWLEDEAIAKVIADFLRSAPRRVAVIKSFWVEPALRGQGHGASLFNMFMDDAKADAVLLVCDLGDTQQKGFDLSEFYKRREFLVVVDDYSYPMMAYPGDLADEIKGTIVSSQAPTETPRHQATDTTCRTAAWPGSTGRER